MSLRFSKKVAFRYLWSRRSEAFITIITVISILGVAIGVMVLNMVMAVMTGFEFELREKIVGTNSHIVVRKLNGFITDWRDASEKITKINGVESVAAFTYNQALIRTDNRSSGLLIRGIEAGSSAAKQLASYLEPSEKIDSLFNPPEVEVLSENGPPRMVRLPGLVVGRELSKSMFLLEGRPVSLLSPSVSSTPFGLMPNFKRFVVAGIYNSGLVEYENSLAYVDLAEAQKFFGMGDTVSGIEVRVKDIYKSGQISAEIKDALGGLSSGFYAQDWTETNKPLWDAIRLEKKAYFVVLLLIIVMASFSIISTLVMVVLEKRKDIAVLKTLGANTSDIGNIFRIHGTVIGGCGTILGLLLGYIGCVLLRSYGFPLDERIFQMTSLPIRIEPINFLIVGAAAFIICSFATVYPARRASRLEPADILRYE